MIEDESTTTLFSWLPLKRRRLWILGVGVAVLMALSFGLSYWGFWAIREDCFLSRSTIVYSTLQLYALSAPSSLQCAEAGGLGWQLNAARFLAPMSATVATGVALFVLFTALLREQIGLLVMRRMSVHTIVCGMGEKGASLVDSLLDAGERVVVIERDPTNIFLTEKRRRGALVLVGDARSSDVLREAGVLKASHLIVLCGDDTANAQVAVQARTLTASRARGSLNCVTHLLDPRLCLLMRRQEIAAGGDVAFRLDFLNIFESGARQILRDHPPVGVSPHIVVVGLGQLGEAVATQVSRSLQSRADFGGTSATVTLVGHNANSTARSLALRHPDLASTCEWVPKEVSLEFSEDELDLAIGEADRPGVRAVYVCVDDDARGLSAALRLQLLLGQGPAEIVVAVTSDRGLGGLLAQSDYLASSNLHVFGLVERTLTLDILRGCTYESLARSMHEDYIRQQVADGHSLATNESMAPWELLPDSLRESNRAQAAHVGVKLKAIDCALVPLFDDGAARFEFSSDEVEQLAELEHQRWVEERRRDGWNYAPGQKNVALKTNPQMVPWEELTDEVKGWDRAFVLGLPKFLALAGLQIIRVEHGKAHE